MKGTGKSIPVKGAVIQEPVLHSIAIIVLASEHDENSQPCKTNNHFAIRNTFTTLWDQTATVSQILGLDRLEHSPFDKAHVVGELKGRADEKTREVRTAVN